MNIIFSNTAWKQYVEWQQIDKSKQNRTIFLGDILWKTLQQII